MPAALTALDEGAFVGSGVRRVDLSRCRSSEFVASIRAQPIGGITFAFPCPT
jgi:hypothetical protein